MRKGYALSSLVGLELRFALDALTNQIPRTVTRDDGTTVQVWDDCLLDQLASMGQESTQGNSGRHSKPGSKPPIRLDVIALRVDMRNAIARVWRADLSGDGTAGQLRAITDYLIGCMDWDACEEWSHRLDGWASTIRDLSGVERARARPLPIDCPACGMRWQYVDNDGETVRKPIMSATFDGDMVLSVDCAACGSWPRGAALDALVSFMRAA